MIIIIEISTTVSNGNCIDHTVACVTCNLPTHREYLTLIEALFAANASANAKYVLFTVASQFLAQFLDCCVLILAFSVCTRIQNLCQLLQCFCHKSN